jgi:hypothetical protein
MGLKPSDVDLLSLWQFAVALRAHNAANGEAPKARSPSSAEHRERMARLA